MKKQKFRKHAQIVLGLLLVLGVIACGSESMVGRLWGQMGELFKVKEAIDDTLIEGETAIEIQNGKVITLGLVNTEFNSAEAAEREKAAGKDFLTALVISYELGARVVESISGQDFELWEKRGWTCDTRGGLNMPPALGKLMGLNEDFSLSKMW